MAEYYGIYRTNFFNVTDANALKADLLDEFVGGSFIYSGEGNSLAIFAGSSGVQEGFPQDPEGRDSVGLFQEVVGRHLLEGEVVILTMIGSKRCVEIGANAYAFNSKGESVELDLRSIEQLAEVKFGKKVSAGF